MGLQPNEAHGDSTLHTQANRPRTCFISTSFANHGWTSRPYSIGACFDRSSSFHGAAPSPFRTKIQKPYAVRPEQKRMCMRLSPVLPSTLRGSVALPPDASKNRLRKTLPSRQSDIQRNWNVGLRR